MARSDSPSSNSGSFRIAETDGFRKQLRKHPELRRVYRLFYSIDETDVIVVVVKLDHRKDPYRQR